MPPSKLVLPYLQVHVIQPAASLEKGYCPNLTINCLLIVIADQNTQAFKEVAIIRHPRIGEYAFGFITSSVTLQVSHSFYV